MRDNYLRQIFIKCVAAILGSQEIRTDKATFEYVVLLAELRMQEMFSDLAQIIKVQRHTQPSIDDLVLWLTRNNIDLLEKQQISGRHVDQLNSLQFDFDVEDISKEQEVFFNPQLFQIKKIVPSTEKVPSYAPEWSPALPPDHTYMATADYPNRVRGLQELHEKLFEEGHMAELALQRLLGSKGSDSAISLRFPGDRPARGHVDVVETAPSNKQSVDPIEPPQDAVSPFVPQHTQESVKIETHTHAPESEDAGMDDAGMDDAGMDDAGMHDGMDHNSMDDINGSGVDPTETAQPAPIKTESEPGNEEPASGEDLETQSGEQEIAPKPYITIVNSEPAPEPPANDKPLSLKINLRKPKKQKASQRPKVDIVEMARRQATEQRQNSEADMDAEETNLQTLLEKAMASVDA